MGGNKTQDGLSLKDILKVALQAGLEVRQGTKTVEYFLKPSSKDLQAALLNNLKKFKDLPRILTRIRAVSTSVTDWCNLFEVHFA